jgi:hypothetical protein
MPMPDMPQPWLNHKMQPIVSRSVRSVMVPCLAIGPQVRHLRQRCANGKSVMARPVRQHFFL